MARTDSIISRLPGFFQSGDRLNNLYRFVEVVGRQVDIAEEDLIRVMRSHWVDTADNQDSKGFDTSEKGDLDKILSLYLEALGGTSLLKQTGRREGAEGIEDDKIYRDRIKGLISVLRNGASTKEGIIAIVAANLGIVGDSQEARDARAAIRVQEFLPEQASVQHFDRALADDFLVENPNFIDVVPQVRLLVTTPIPSPFVNPALVNRETGEFARYIGTIMTGDELSFLTDGTALLNGSPVPLEGTTPALNPGFSRLRITGGYGLPEGYFDQSRWDFARFEQSAIVFPGIFDESRWDEAVFNDGTPLFAIDVSLERYTPGTFMVRIPWDIPGYTELLDTLPDKPREQIRFIVSKVKAAGTFAVITYEKNFTENHVHEDALTIADHMPIEHQDMQEHNFSISSIATPYPGGLQHELGSALHLSGVFDFTTFDSLNTFA